MESLLHSKIIGQGFPLLILHGYFGMGDNWKSIANKLAENYQVHLIDQRNHGRSFHSQDFNYQLLVRDLLVYTKYYNLNKINLLGHSMGGKTAMLFATKYPEMINKLVVVDISPREYPPHHQNILEGLNSINFSIQNSRKLIDEKLKEFIPEQAVRQFLLKSVYWKEKDELSFRFNLKSLTENDDKVGEALVSNAVFKGNTLFLKGQHSDYITQAEKPLIKKHFPNSKIAMVENSGHWLHAENPTDFYKEVFGFLNDIVR